MTDALKYNYGQVSVPTRFATGQGAFTRALQYEMTALFADLQWACEDESNAHIGPRHRPGRAELYLVREAERRAAYIRSLGHPAGKYRR